MINFSEAPFAGLLHEISVFVQFRDTVSLFPGDIPCCNLALLGTVPNVGVPCQECQKCFIKYWPCFS